MKSLRRNRIGAAPVVRVGQRVCTVPLRSMRLRIAEALRAAPTETLANRPDGAAVQPHRFQTYSELRIRIHTAT
eukprot:COSAG06_NODE_49741_length_323_cov_0.861607_1_plen_73_part_01